MSTRTVLGAAAALLLVALAGLGFLAYRQFTTTSVAGDLPFAIGGPFALVDGDGKTVTDRDFHGKWMVIYFGYTHCPDACPTALNAIALALDQLPAATRARIQPLFITIDPERDTPAVMKEYVAAFGAGIVGLTGDAAALKPIEAAYRVVAEKHPTPDGGYDMDHSSIIYVMGPDGKYATNFTGEDSAAGMAARLARVVS